MSHEFYTRYVLLTLYKLKYLIPKYMCSPVMCMKYVKILRLLPYARTISIQVGFNFSWGVSKQTYLDR